MSNELLKTKLFIPRLRAGMVARPRLLQKLENGLAQGKRLTLISAPPGFGKSTLIIEWIASLSTQDAPPGSPKFCWLTLDESDSDPVSFWRYLIAALQTGREGLGSTALAALQSPQAPSLSAVVATLINELAGLPDRLALVLDDYHLIDSAPIHESINFFLDHLPPQLHPILTTRADPPLQLARRRGRGEMNEIRGADLRFTHSEIAAFFNTGMRLGLSDSDLAALENRTEGWIVGMQMAALSLQDSSDRHSMVEAFSGEDRYIADYLVEEVLNRQPPEIQDFLLKTSALDRLSSPLCDYVMESGESRVENRESSQLSPLDSRLSTLHSPFSTLDSRSSQPILDYLERSNLFLIPLDNHRQWFRYHHLFAALLRQKLELRAGRSAASAYQRLACQWFEQNGYIPEAIRLALSCGDFEVAARMLEAYASQMFMLSDLSTLVKWALNIPEPVLLAHPALVMAAAWAAHATGHIPETRRLLGLVESVAGGSIKTHVLAEDRLAQLTPLGRAALIEGSVLYMRIALDYESAENAVTVGERVLPYLVSERDGEPFLFNVPSGLRSPTLFLLAVAAKRRGDLEAAWRGFEEAGVIAQRPPENIHIIALAYGYLAQIEIEQGKIALAEATCQKALNVIQGYPILPTAFFGMTYVNLAQLAFDRGDFAAAEGELQKGLELGRLWNFWECLIPGCLLLARLRQAQGDPSRAQAALQELATLGAKEPFVLRAIDSARATLHLAQPQFFQADQSKIENLKSKIPFPPNSALAEPLSPRELEVLHLMSGGASNAEIAQRLYLSVNTIKKHITSIFGKLGVTTRVQALDRARKAGLIL